MYYQSDFNSIYAKSLSDARRGKRKLNKRHLEPEVIIKHESDEEDGADETCVEKWFESFTENTSIHGIKFTGQSRLHWSERLIWSCLVSVAIFFAIYICLQLSEKFSSSPLSTVVESTIFPVFEIAYPSVTICPHNRLHAQRCIEAEAKFLPNATEETLEIFRHLLASMNNIEFGGFDEFRGEVFQHTASDELNRLSLHEVYQFTMLACEEIFIGRCWWRNKYHNCCDDLFNLQTSEYGLCFSFNSGVNEIGLAKELNESIHYPLRTSNYGEWSGLRVDLATRSDLSLAEQINGIKLIISHPDQWPNSGHFVPSGSTTSITIKPTFSYTTDDVRRLEPEQRQCLNDDESKSAMTLPGLKYLQLNCVSECRQQHLQKYCNCSLSLFFPIGSFRDCNFDDLKCLFQHNDILNYEKPPASNPFFEEESEGMVCGCLPECHRIDYSIEITSNILAASDNLTLDLHYQSANLVKYRTDVTFGWLDLMVAFGGIAGLFLGCSILSGVEILYYAAILGVILARRLKRSCDRFLKDNSKEFRARDTLHVDRQNEKADSVRTINIRVISLTDIDKDGKESSVVRKSKGRF